MFSALAGARRSALVNKRFSNSKSESNGRNKGRNGSNKYTSRAGSANAAKGRFFEFSRWIPGASVALSAAVFSVLTLNGEEQLAEPYTDWPVEEHPLVFAPNVPPPITRNSPSKVKITIPTTVEEMSVDGVHNFEYWTFGGQVPGPFIRVRVGDVLDVTMENKDTSGMLHNLDFHAVSGPGGGALQLTADSGSSKRALFKMLYPGLFIYHCAVAPVGEHIGRGMYGLILVEPEGGLPKVDREYYVFQSEFYLEDDPVPSNRDPTKKIYQMDDQRALDERPTYVVFNGRVGALTDDGALPAKTGDRVRLFFGNGGPNLVSSFHVIGTIFDKVYREGDLISHPGRGIQTTTVPAGGAAVIEMDLPVPGYFTLVDHSIWRIEKGAIGFIKVDGAPRGDIFWSAEAPRSCPDCSHHP